MRLSSCFWLSFVRQIFFLLHHPFSFCSRNPHLFCHNNPFLSIKSRDKGMFINSQFVKKGNFFAIFSQFCTKMQAVLSVCNLQSSNAVSHLSAEAAGTDSAIGEIR